MTKGNTYAKAKRLRATRVASREVADTLSSGKGDLQRALDRWFLQLEPIRRENELRRLKVSNTTALARMYDELDNQYTAIDAQHEFLASLDEELVQNERVTQGLRAQPRAQMWLQHVAAEAVTQIQK